MINGFRPVRAGLVISAFLLWCGSTACSQHDRASDILQPPAAMVEAGKAHYRMRIAQIREQGSIRGGVVFAGDSLIEGGQWSKAFPDLQVLNHGIGYDTSLGLKNRLNLITRHAPDQIVLMIGTNDLGYGKPPEQVAAAVREITRSLRRDVPNVAIVLLPVLPREASVMPQVVATNAEYRRLAMQENGVVYAEISGAFASNVGTLRADLTYDGLHLNAAGYTVLVNALKPFILAE